MPLPADEEGHEEGEPGSDGEREGEVASYWEAELQRVLRERGES